MSISPIHIGDIFGYLKYSKLNIHDKNQASTLN